MGDGAAGLAAAIGARVRQERQARGWTLDALAEAAGVSRRLVVNVEQGAANPSVSTLLRLADALGVGLPSLVEPPEPVQPRPAVRVTRAGEGALLWQGDKGGRGVLLVGGDAPDVVELWEWTLAPGETYVSEPHSEGTTELLHLRQGALLLTVDGEEHLLRAGDAVVFEAHVPHTYANPRRSAATFSLAVLQPEVGA